MPVLGATERDAYYTTKTGRGFDPVSRKEADKAVREATRRS